MATPYFQVRRDRVASTQDEARERLGPLPVAVIAAAQSEGRGRQGAEWLTADRALAVSLAWEDPDEMRPVSLIAAVAAARLGALIGLKWPNDVMSGDDKVGGILVERSGDVIVAGLGLNLWWPQAPSGMGALYAEDSGPERHAHLGALWAAELMRLLESPGWPRTEYRELSVTLGQDITWDGEGAGTAVDVTETGELVVDVGGDTTVLRSGEIRHIRPAD